MSRYWLLVASFITFTAAAQSPFSVTSSLNPSVAGLPVTFVVRDVTGYTAGWANPPTQVIVEVRTPGGPFQLLGYGTVLTKATYQFTTSSLPDGDNVIRFDVVNGDPATGGTITSSDPFLQRVLAASGAEQAIPALSGAALGVLGATMLVIGLMQTNRLVKRPTLPRTSVVADTVRDGLEHPFITHK